MKYLFTITLFFLNSIAFSQIDSGVKIAIYSEGENVLLPSLVKEFNVLNDTNSNKIFSEITYVNRLYANLNYEKYLREVVNYYSDNNIVLSEDAALVNESIYSKLVGYDFFVRVSTNIIGEIIEYQLELYSTVNRRNVDQGEISEFPSLNLSEELKSVNFVLNLRSQDVSSVFKKNISKLFPSSNYLPVPIINVNKEIVNDTAFCGLNDIMIMNGYDSYDLNSTDNKLSFKWNQDLSIYNNILSDIIIQFDRPSSPLQKIKFSKTGLYKLSLTVSDGISDGVTDTLLVKVIANPIIDVSREKRRYFSFTDTGYNTRKKIKDSFNLSVYFDRKNLMKLI